MRIKMNLSTIISNKRWYPNRLSFFQHTVAIAAISLCMSIVVIGQSVSPAPTPLTTGPEFVDALNKAFGKQTTQRATHAKGVVLLGSFKPSAEAANISKAANLNQSVPVTIRFSDNTGILAMSDKNGLARPHGLAIRFMLPDGTATDLVTHSYNGFPAKSPEDMRQLLLAVGASAGAAEPTPIQNYIAAHPAAKDFLTKQDAPPVSFATIPYFGVNTFKFTNAQGKSIFGRYQILPDGGKLLLSKDQVDKSGDNYLFDEISDRVGKGPIKFRLVLQLSTAADKLDDPSIAWSDSNPIVELGTFSIDKIVADQDAANSTLVFIPSMLPPGIEPADPMIRFRGTTYPVSYDRRH